jgi:hypothetical protein
MLELLTAFFGLYRYTSTNWTMLALYPLALSGMEPMLLQH